MEPGALLFLTKEMDIDVHTFNFILNGYWHIHHNNNNKNNINYNYSKYIVKKFIFCIDNNLKFIPM